MPRPFARPAKASGIESRLGVEDERIVIRQKWAVHSCGLHCKQTRNGRDGYAYLQKRSTRSWSLQRIRKETASLQIRFCGASVTVNVSAAVKG